MDVSETLVPKSDQLDAVDLASGPQTFTIEKVSKGNADQPLNVKLKEFPRVWRPSKNMRRVLAFCYSTDATQWENKRVTLFCDPEVVFGGVKVGGIRISHASDIGGQKNVPLILTKGRSTMYPVQPLKESAPKPPSPAQQLDPETERALADLKQKFDATEDEAEKADLLAQRDRLMAGGAF